MSSDSSIHGNSLGSMVSTNDQGPNGLSTQSGPAPGEGGATIGPKSILHAVRRRWKFAMPIGLLLSAILGAGGWFLLEPKYTAIAYLRLNANESPLLFQTADQGKIDFKLYKNTQAQLMKTPFVVNAALRDQNISGLKDIKDQQDALNYLQESVSVSYPGDSELMQVSYSSTNADNAVKIVNAIVDAFEQEVVNSERNDRVQRLDSLGKVYGTSEEKVRNKRAELKRMATALGTGDSESLTVAQQSALQQFGDMQKNLSEVKFELMQAEGDLKVAREIAAKIAEAREQNPDEQANDQEAAVNMLIERTPEVATLRNDIDLLQVGILSLSETYGTGFPKYRQAKKELDSKQELLAKRREVARVDALETVKKNNAENEQRRMSGASAMQSNRTFDTISLETNVGVLKEQESLLQMNVDELSAETRKLGSSSIEIELLRSEIDNQEDVLKRIDGEIQRTEIEVNSKPRIKVVSKASTATLPDVKKRITRSAALSLFGLFAPLALLVVWDLTHRRVDSTDSVSDAVSVPTLGAFPRVSERILFRDPPEGHRLEKDRLRLVEAIDSVGSMIQFLARSDESKVFLITSAIPSEGKSTVACQLATSLSRSGNRVILVDFDLRRPSVHRYLKLANEAGVSEVLEGQIELDEALQSFDNENLTVLTAGTQQHSLQSMCTKGAVEQLMAQLRRDYDFVIVDSCPILPVADTRSLVKYCDSVVLTLVRDLSRLPLVAQACSILRSYRAQIIGGVMIGANAIGYAKHYYTPNNNRKTLNAKSEADEEVAVVEAN